MTITKREERAARAAERRWAPPKWTAADRRLVECSIHCAIVSLPSAGPAWEAHVNANAKAIVLADLEAFAAMREKSVADAADRLPAMRADLAELVSRHGDCARAQTEADRVRWHEKGAARDAAKARGFRRLIEKIECHGLPPKA